MTILAIETSTPAGSLALWRDGTLVAEAGFVTERSHNAALFKPLATALEQVGSGEEVLLVVGRGPGSYTGVRIGIAAAQGLGLARGWPVLGLGLGASLASIGATSGWISGDARRGDCFLQECVRGELGEPRLGPLGELLATLPKGVRVAATEARWRDDPPAGVVVEPPEARVLAASAAALGEAELRRRTGQPLEPAYVRAPFVTRPKSRARQIR